MVVVVGILLALGINSWNAAVTIREESYTLNRWAPPPARGLQETVGMADHYPPRFKDALRAAARAASPLTSSFQASS